MLQGNFTKRNQDNMNIKQDREIMKLLKVNTISYLIASTTPLGELRKVLRYGEDDYHYTLDSVQLDKETAKELIKILNG